MTRLEPPRDGGLLPSGWRRRSWAVGRARAVNLRQLEYFVSVAELGSFSKAAKMLEVAQPALSRQVRRLETGLRVTLLLRNGRGVVLTEAGKRLFEHSVGILRLVARAREEVEGARDEPAGRIVVGLPPSIGRLLTRALVEGFRRSLPRARLAIVEGLSAHLAEWISTGRVDVGLLYNPDPQPTLDIAPVLEEPLGVVSPASPRGARARRDALTLEEAARLDLVLPERSHAIRKLLETQAALAGHRLRVALEVSSVASILELVRSGHGHAVLTPSALAASGDPAAFRLRPIVAPALTSTLCIAVSAHKPATPLSARVAAMLRQLVETTVARRSHNRTA
jgi:LysR family nitrogen assimilation transcriptional regulator